MIEYAIEHALYCDLEKMLKKRILNRTLDQDHALCLLGNYVDSFNCFTTYEV